MSNTLNACAVISLDCVLNCSAYGVYVQLGNVVPLDVTLPPIQFLCAQKTCQRILSSVVSILSVGLKLIVHIGVEI